jgi:hypothetical protein
VQIVDEMEALSRREESELFANAKENALKECDELVKSQ